MISNYFKTAKDDRFQQLPSPKEGCWIHVEDTTPEDINTICQLTSLDISDLHDCLDKYELPRIEKIKNAVLIFTRQPIQLDAAAGLHTATLTMILTSHYFISLSLQKTPSITQFIQKPNKFSTLQRSKLLIHLFLRIIHDFMTQIRFVRQNVMTQEKEMIQVDSEDITALTRYEEVLNQYLSTLEPTRHVLEEIVSGRYTSLYEKDQELLEDLGLAVGQSEDLCNIAIKSIRSLRDSYQIIFTNNLHKTIKLLTALTIIFNIPTIVSSIYGMNVKLPFAEAPHSFSIVMSGIIACSFAALLFFRRNRWL